MSVGSTVGEEDGFDVSDGCTDGSWVTDGEPEGTSEGELEGD